MGTLSEMGAGIGQQWAGGTDAASLARRSMGYGALATGLDVGANIGAGIGAVQQSQYAAKNLNQQSEAVRRAGQYEESAVKGKFTRLEATQKVTQAASGIDTNSKSAVAVRDATADIGAMDAAMVHFNAAREAYGLEKQASLIKRAGAYGAVRGVAGAATSFLSGASSLSDKWLAYKRNVPGYE